MTRVVGARWWVQGGGGQDVGIMSGSHMFGHFGSESGRAQSGGWLVGADWGVFNDCGGKKWWWLCTMVVELKTVGSRWLTIHSFERGGFGLGLGIWHRVEMPVSCSALVHLPYEMMGLRVGELNQEVVWVWTQAVGGSLGVEMGLQSRVGVPLVPLRNDESTKINGGWLCPRVEYECKNKNKTENDSGNSAE